MKRELLLLKAGGSIFSKSKENIFDFDLVLKYKSMLEAFKNTHQFVWILGGGYLCRMYQDYLETKGINNTGLDEVGVASNNLNATLVKIALGEEANPKVIMNAEITHTTEIKFSEFHQVVGAEKVGQTSDGASLTIALKAGVKKIFSLKNIDGVYSADPRKNYDAKYFEKLSWDEYLDIIKTKEHLPGGHFPVDPISSLRAKENNIQFIILDGVDLSNLKNAIEGNTFRGTTIG